MRILLLLVSPGIILSAQTVEIQGTIKARQGAALIVQASDSPEVIVRLTGGTQVDQSRGVLEARRREMSMAALIPGLRIQAEGTYDDRDQLVATRVKFQGNDLERARSIHVGLPETQARVQLNRGELKKQNADLKVQIESLKQHQGQLTAQQEKIAANKATIDAAIARFGQLDNYYILDEVTVHFGNGKVTIAPPYETKLLNLAEKAKAIEAYNIQVVSYASTVGSVALNQQISEDRADSIASFLVQQGDIPLTNLMAPGAMGETRQMNYVFRPKTAEQWLMMFAN